MKIDLILKDSAYKINQKLFSEDIIQDLENSIFEKETKKGKAYYTRCIIREKEIQLKPEEVIRQLYLRKLIKEYRYPKDRIRVEYPIHFGREVKKADIVVMEKDRPETPYIIVEVKKPKLKEGKDQLKSYTNATGAPIAVWTNGERIEYFHRRDPNYFESISDIPRADQRLRDLIGQKFTIEDLKRIDKLVNERVSLKDIIIDLEDEILANAGVDVFEEVFKLIFTKLYDELLSIRDRRRNLEFRNYGETDAELKEKIQRLFDEAKQKWEGIFSPDSRIELSPSHLAICVSSLQDIKIFNTNLDVIDDAFEYLVNKTSKGEKGQYFTPRYVIDMAVKMLNPTEEDYIIDPACGSFGFPIHAVFKVWKDIYEELGLDEKELLTGERKHDRALDYVQNKVFGIDFDEKVVRVAKLLNLIAGDGHANVIRLNSLDWELWKEWIEDEDWRDRYYEGWRKLKRLLADKNDYSRFNFDLLLTNPPFAGEIKESRIIHRYDIARSKNGKYPSKISRDILFIERALKMLKPGGRMAIVLPQGRLNNATDRYIREFITQHARILAVVGLHQNVFKPHTGTKTSVLFLQKWDDELCPKVEDYPIFFATMREPSKDNSGEKIFVKYKDFLQWEEEGKIPQLPEEFKRRALENPEEKVLDKYGHLIVKHDLYSVETEFEGVRTPEGIAEAFLEFAKREGFSFVKKKSIDEGFDEERYKELLSRLEAVELRLSEVKEDNPYFRIDSEFFKKEFLKTISFIKQKHYAKLEELSVEIIHPTEIKREYSEKGYWFLRAQNVRPLYIEESNRVYIKKEEANLLKNNLIKKFDILITRTGANFGDTALYYLEEKAFASSHTLIARAKNFSNLVLAIFLNTEYGRNQINKGMYGGLQPEIAPAYLKKIYVPLLSRPFQSQIETLVKEAYRYLEESKQLYKEAENLLLEELGLKNFEPTEENIAIISSKETFLSGRLDAEYYLPKYRQIEEKIKAYRGGWDYLGNVVDIYDDNFLPKEDVEYRYIELSNIGGYGDIMDYTVAKGKDLPTRARRLVRSNQVIVSSVEGSLGKVALITEKFDRSICSTGFYVVDSKILNSETLLVLFKIKPVIELIKKHSSGTILTAINKEDFVRIPIPKVDKNKIQPLIKQKIQNSFLLREKSKKLLELAKRVVELAIEQDERTAFKFIKDRAEEIEHGGILS